MSETTPVLPELLSPAGDEEKLHMAVRYGADAVYLGGSAFTMRAGSSSFEGESLERAVAYCHERGVKVYLTCNSLPRCDELAALQGYLRSAAKAGVDAFIVADLGVMMAARRIAPQTAIHVSTQMGVVNPLTACELFALGAKRVVLARELSLSDIKTIRDRTPPSLELEAFVHGAMCMSFSGRCLISEYLTGRDANRGQCAQPCRWRYSLVEEKRPGVYYSIEEDARGSYLFNARDLCMIEHLQALRSAGVTSFKIEGRNKSAYYAAVVTNAYRAALEALDTGRPVPEWVVDETLCVSHRPYCTGFYFGPPENGQYTENAGYIRRREVVAVVEGYRQGKLLLSQRGRFFQGDVLEALEPRRPPQTLPVTALFDAEERPISVAPHPMMKVSIPTSLRLPAGSLLRKCVDENA